MFDEKYLKKRIKYKWLDNIFIGIELDKNYFEIAKNRIEKE